MHVTAALALASVVLHVVEPSRASPLAPPAVYPATSGSATVAPPPTKADGVDHDPREGLDPFPSTGRYLDYGMGFHSEALLTSGRLCPRLSKENCVLGSGAGVSFGGAVRNQGYSLGAVYEVTFHDSSNIYQRGVLQQLRGEWRVRPRVLLIADSVVGFVGVGAGLAGYGDNWAVGTYGAAAHGMFGGEFDLGVKVALVVTFAYRAVYLRTFTDPSGTDRPAGVAHMLGISLALELHDPL